MINEIQTVKQEIRVLEAKLSLLEEMEKYKTSAEEAYKKTYGNYPMGEPFWIVFKKGYEAAQLKDDGVAVCPDDPPEYDEIEWDEKDNLTKSEMSEFRQKLFDGIESIFYKAAYKNTHWEMKVNMAVDEVLSHFYDVIPDENEVPYDKYEKGWNDCIDAIKGGMEIDDDN